MEMILGRIFKVNYNKKSCNECKVLKDIIDNITKEDCIIHFCDYIENTEIKNLKGLEKALLYKLRKNIRNFYLRLDMDVNYSKLTKEELFKSIEYMRVNGINSLEETDNYNLFNDLMQFDDDSCYLPIICELKKAEDWAITRITPEEKAQMNLEFMNNEREDLLDEIKAARNIMNKCEERISAIDFDIKRVEEEIDEMYAIPF